MERAIIEADGVYLNGEEVYGIVLVRVLCPPDTFYPFLMFRNEISGKVCLPVCRLCCETEETNICAHSVRYGNQYITFAWLICFPFQREGLDWHLYYS